MLTKMSEMASWKSFHHRWDQSKSSSKLGLRCSRKCAANQPLPLFKLGNATWYGGMQFGVIGSKTCQRSARNCTLWIYCETIAKTGNDKMMPWSRTNYEGLPEMNIVPNVSLHVPSKLCPSRTQVQPNTFFWMETQMWIPYSCMSCLAHVMLSHREWFLPETHWSTEAIISWPFKIPKRPLGPILSLK